MNLSAIKSFDKSFDPLSMNSKFETGKFEPETTFEKTINETKANIWKSITSIEINLSAITSNKKSASSEHLKSDLMSWILLLSPGKPPQFTKHLYSI